MDFLERMGEQIGERYLMNKANAAPQQLENLVKKQLKGGAAEPEGAGNGEKIAAAAAAGHEGPTAPGAGTSEKDEEIARLRAQLAQTKLDKGALTAGAKKGSSTGKANTKTKELEELGAGAGITRGANGRKQEAPKEMKGLKALSAGAAASKASKGKSESASVNRQLSAVSRAAKQELPPLSIVARKPKSEKKVKELAAISGTGAATRGSSKFEKAYYGSEASSSLGRRHSISANHSRHETESNTPSHTDKPRRSKSVKQPSEDGSSVYSIAPSRRPAQYPSETAPTRPPPEYGHRKGVNGYAEPSESGSLVRYIPMEAIEVGRGETHVIVVEEEEDVPVRRKSTNGRGGGVVKLSSRQGRTVYMVR